MKKVEKTVQVGNKQGMHARTSAMFVQIANKYVSQVSVSRGDEKVNGKSIMGILMLGADYQSQLTLIAEGVDAQEAIDELGAFVEQEN